MLISDEYREQLRTLHKGKWGDEGHLWTQRVLDMVKRTGATSVLDYGCGKGTLRPTLPHTLDVREYDPAIPGKDSPPAPADLLVSFDVLEHIEPDKLDAVLGHMHTLAVKGAFVVVATKAARAKLPDGRNAHLIIERPLWWTEKLSAVWPEASITFVKDKVHMRWIR